MTAIRWRPVALVVVATLCFTYLPMQRPAYADSTPTRTWQLGLAVGVIAGFTAYLFWSVFHEGGVSQREFDRERREIYVREHRELEPRKAEAISRGRLIRFMTTDEVYASWGRPDEIQEQERATNSPSHWIWRKGKNSILHAFFFNGLLDRWYEERPEDE